MSENQPHHVLWVTIGGGLVALMAVGLIAYYQSTKPGLALFWLLVSLGVAGVYAITAPFLGLRLPQTRSEPFWRGRAKTAMPRSASPRPERMLATPLDAQAEAAATWVRNQTVMVCQDVMEGAKETASLEGLCVLWHDALATLVTQDALETVAKHVYPCIPKVHSGLWTKRETEDCRRRFVRSALNLLALENLVEEEPRHGSDTVKPAAYGDDRHGDVVVDTSYSVFRWTPLGRATVKRLTGAEHRQHDVVDVPVAEAVVDDGHRRSLHAEAARFQQAVSSGHDCERSRMAIGVSFALHFPSVAQSIDAWHQACERRRLAEAAVIEQIARDGSGLDDLIRNVLAGSYKPEGITWKVNEPHPGGPAEVVAYPEPGTTFFCRPIAGSKEEAEAQQARMSGIVASAPSWPSVVERAASYAACATLQSSILEALDVLLETHRVRYVPECQLCQPI